MMHDFFYTDPDEMYYKELTDKVRYFKEDEKGVTAMCKAMEDMRNEAEKKAEERITVKVLVRNRVGVGTVWSSRM